MKFTIKDHNSRLYGDYAELALCLLTLVVLLHTVAVNTELENQVSDLNDGAPVLQSVQDECLDSVADIQGVVVSAPEYAAVYSPVSTYGTIDSADCISW